MHFATLFLPALAGLALSAEAETLRRKNWDLHLLTPGCSPNSSNYDVSVYHRSGLSADSCVSLKSDGNVNTSQVETISWKSPIEKHYDLCTFKDGECSKEGFIEAIRSDWEVCYPYKGWVGWKVVAFGEPCF